MPRATGAGIRGPIARGRRCLAGVWSRASCRFARVKSLPCEDLLDLGHYVARAFGSKFRAITRAITPGHPGEGMVTHGPSRKGTRSTLETKPQARGHLTCSYVVARGGVERRRDGPRRHGG